MPDILVEETITCDINRLWDRICDVESYGHFMEPVISTRILSESGRHREVAWEIMLKGSILKWVEDEVAEPGTYRLTFEQRDGDLELFDGYWQLKPVDSETSTAVLFIRFEIGIPMLRDMLNPVAERALRENARQMLRSFDKNSARLAS